MKDILIDTNIYSMALRGDEDTVAVLRKADSIGICSISIGELLSGFRGGKQERKNKKELDEFLDTPRVTLYCIDEITAEFYAEILNVLRKKGKPVPTNDLWIASVAFQYGLKLFSPDRHFSLIPGLFLL